MSCLCIGGVCIPYSAILPLLLLGLQWIAAKLARLGLLPEWIGKKLASVPCAACKGVSQTGNIEPKECCTKYKCCTEESSVTESSTENEQDRNETNALEHIDSLSRWQSVFTSSKSDTLIVKFTAEWCKPCKQIQPCYSNLSLKYGRCTFVTLDVDGDECDIISSKMKVAMMPTFICFQNGEEVGRMTGGNSEEKLKEWVGQFCAKA